VIASVALGLLLTAPVEGEHQALVDRLVAAHLEQQASDHAWDLMGAVTLFALGADAVAASLANPHCCFEPSDAQRISWGIPGILLATTGALAIAVYLYAALHPDGGAAWRDLSLSKIREQAYDHRRTRQINGWLTVVSGALLTAGTASFLATPGSVWFSSGYLWVGLSCAA
jgi:hypothetical protein